VHKKCEGQQDIALTAAQIAQYPDNRGRDALSFAFARQVFSKQCILSWSETSDVVYRLRVRPHVTSLITQDGKIIDEESGIEYKFYDIYLMGRHATLEPGSVYQIMGRVIPDPRSQKVTLFATSLAKDASAEYDLQKIRELRDHLSGMSVEDRAGWLVNNFQRYSKIRKRRDVILADFLTFFSRTYIEFDGKEYERGWLILTLIGDSTTGKSEIVKKMIRLLGGGQYVVAETASMVGLSATATQTTNGWFVEWGPLVLGDRRLIAIDGAQKLTKRDWSTLAEAQRLGLVRLVKAAKGEAPARTRTTIIANPVNLESYEKSTKEMGGFLYPYTALATIMDIQSMARLDLAVFVNAGDVTAEDINATVEEEPDPCLANLKDLRSFVWEGRYNIEYDSEFVDAVHRHATNLYRKFHVSSVPLVSIDMKYKLVRLSTALALATCSLKDDASSFNTIVVTKEHVDYVASFLDGVYTKAGLHEGARKEKDGDVDQDQVQEIIGKICEKIGADKDKVTEILKWMGLQASFSLDQLKTAFNLAEKNELKPLVSMLQTEGIISRGRGFVMTAKGVKVVKLLLLGR
jgi:hypothetical protein